MVRNYDDCMRPFERRVFGEARARLVPLADGRVLDVGAGTGANFPHYAAASLVAAVDPEGERPETLRARALVAAAVERLRAAG